MAQPQFIDSLLPGNPVFIAVTLNLNYLLFRYFQYAFHLDDYFRFGAKVRKILTLSYTCWAGRFRYELLDEPPDLFCDGEFDGLGRDFTEQATYGLVRFEPLDV